QSSGFIYFVYYDRRNYDDTRTDVYISTSRDGGKTFVDTKVSEKPFIPSTEMFFGDYLNIDAVDGQIRPIWPSMTDEKIKLHVGLVSEKALKK
ncbi:MAG: glycosyl hydrolase, partial [Crocinitomicaceae bacterium]|nr:glycosyl hydrolase [Crocinitomicaceae bacterium]